MAIIAFTASGSEPGVAVPPGNRRRVSVNLTGDASYPTGGSTINPLIFGMSKIDQVMAGFDTTGVRYYVWDSINSKLKAFDGVGTEEANATVCSADIIPAVIWGI